MISLESTRQKVMTLFKTVHDAAYPTTKVNYPNYVVVDIENQSAPFVSIDLTFDNIDQLAMQGSANEIKPKGRLSVIYYYRENTGTAGAYSYLDGINDGIAFKNVDGIMYNAPSEAIDIQTFPGWVGKMESIKFDVPLGVDC